MIAGLRSGETDCPVSANSCLEDKGLGALVVNPFGQQAFRKGPASKVVVKPGESFRLRYGVLLHAGPPDATPDLKAAFADFISQLSL